MSTGNDHYQIPEGTVPRHAVGCIHMGLYCQKKSDEENEEMLKQKDDKNLETMTNMAQELDRLVEKEKQSISTKPSHDDNIQTHPEAQESDAGVVVGKR